MREVREGHRYELASFENKDNVQTVQFIEKELVGTTDLATVYDGTTNEEVLEMLITRMKYLQNKFPCTENEAVILRLIDALGWLNKRTEDRKARSVEGKHIE